MPVEGPDAARQDRLTTGVELAIRLGVLAFFLYWAFILIRPFITIAIWSTVLTVALDPITGGLPRVTRGNADCQALAVGGRRTLVLRSPVRAPRVNSQRVRLKA
jgi:hypothetical protein